MTNDKLQMTNGGINIYYKYIHLTFVIGSLVIVGLAGPANAVFLQTKDQASQASKAETAKTPLSVNFAMQTFRLKYANAKAMGETIKELLGEGEGVSVNAPLNVMIVRASDKNLKRIVAIVEKIDTPPLQVQVEAKIIELKSGSGDSTNPSSVGASWRYSHRPGSTTNYMQSMADTQTNLGSMAAESVGLYAELLSGNVQAYLTAVEKTIGYDLLASPWVTALNHEPASILIGSKYGYKTSIISQTSTVQEVKFLEVGTKLTFTPHINEDGYITMDIFPSISEGLVKDDLPQEDTTETRNKVLVKDGQSIVIGGLTKTYKRQIDTGVPILSAVPFLGQLFRKTEFTTEKRDIMVIITPHIVTPAFLEEMAKRRDELETRRQEWSEKAKLIH